MWLSPQLFQFLQFCQKCVYHSLTTCFNPCSISVWKYPKETKGKWVVDCHSSKCYFSLFGQSMCEQLAGVYTCYWGCACSVFTLPFLRCKYFRCVVLYSKANRAWCSSFVFKKIMHFWGLEKCTRVLPLCPLAVFLDLKHTGNYFLREHGPPFSIW